MKQSGLGDALFISGYDLSGDIQAVGNIGGGPAALEFTGINKSAHERKGGKLDGRLQATTYFNPGPAADAAHRSATTASEVTTGSSRSRWRRSPTCSRWTGAGP